MKALGIALLFLGYSGLVWGISNIENHCYSWKSLVWPGSTLSDPCGGNNGGLTGSSGSSTSTSSTSSQQGSTAIGSAVGQPVGPGQLG
jgi:hypothetical protein